MPGPEFPPDSLVGQPHPAFVGPYPPNPPPPAPDLAVMECHLTLPHPPSDHDHTIVIDPEDLDVDFPPHNDGELTEIDLAAHRPFLFQRAHLRATVRNLSGAPAGSFIIRLTFGIADPNEDHTHIEWVSTVSRDFEVDGLWKIQGPVDVEAYFPVRHRIGRLYVGIAEVNPLTDEHPLGQVAERNYSNNRCSHVYYYYPEYRPPVIPEPDFEIPVPELEFPEPKALEEPVIRRKL